MKGFFAIALIACWLMLPVSIASGTDLGSTYLSNCPNCSYCHLTPQEIIEKASGEVGIPYQRAWEDYVNNNNHITPIDCGWSVCLRESSGSFVVIDLIDDL